MLDDIEIGTPAQGGSRRSLRQSMFGWIRHDPALFRAVKVDSRSGTIVWDNGADLDPDVLCQGLTSVWMEAENAAG